MAEQSPVASLDGFMSPPPGMPPSPLPDSSENSSENQTAQTSGGVFAADETEKQTETTEVAQPEASSVSTTNPSEQPREEGDVVGKKAPREAGESTAGQDSTPSRIHGSIIAGTATTTSNSSDAATPDSALRRAQTDASIGLVSNASVASEPMHRGFSEYMQSNKSMSESIPGLPQRNNSGGKDGEGNSTPHLLPPRPHMDPLEGTGPTTGGDEGRSSEASATESDVSDPPLSPWATGGFEHEDPEDGHTPQLTPPPVNLEHPQLTPPAAGLEPPVDMMGMVVATDTNSVTQSSREQSTSSHHTREVAAQGDSTPEAQLARQASEQSAHSPQLPRSVSVVSKVKFREDSQRSVAEDDSDKLLTASMVARSSEQPKVLSPEEIAAAKTQDGLPRAASEGSTGDSSPLGNLVLEGTGVISEETIISNESFVQTRGRAWSRKMSGLPANATAIIKERFSAFAQNYCLCYGLAEGLPKSVHGFVIDTVIALARFSGTEGTIVTHMLLKEYLRAMKKNESHNFMRGNSFAPTLIDRVTGTSLKQLLTPTVEEIADKVTAVNETTNPELALGLDKLTELPITGEEKAEDEEDLSSTQRSSTGPPEWVKAVLEFVTEILDSITNAIDATSHDSSVAPFYHAIAELIRVATIIDRKWAVPESRFMDSTVLSAYPETSASGRCLKNPASKDDLHHMLEGDAADAHNKSTTSSNGAAAAASAPKASGDGEGGKGPGGTFFLAPGDDVKEDQKVAGTESAGGDNELKGGDSVGNMSAASGTNSSSAGIEVVNEDQVDSMLSTLIMLRVLSPMMATKSVEVMRQAMLPPSPSPQATSEGEGVADVPSAPEAPQPNPADARRGQKRMVAIAKLLQKAANHRLYDAPHEAHLKELNRYLPSLSKRLHAVLRRTTKPMFKRQLGATEEHPETELLAREKSFAFARSPGGVANIDAGSQDGASPRMGAAAQIGSPQGRSSCLKYVSPEDDIETIWLRFQSIIRSYWLPISHSMLEIQPLLIREHTSQIDKVSDLYHEHSEEMKHAFENMKHEHREIQETVTELEAAKKKRASKSGMFSKLLGGGGSTTEEQREIHVAKDRLDAVTKTLNYTGLAYHGYRRLRRLLKGDQYYVALPSGMTRHGHSCVVIYGDQVALAHSHYQSRANSVKEASMGYLPTYPNHQKFNDLHIVADIAAALHLATVQNSAEVKEFLASENADGFGPGYQDLDSGISVTGAEGDHKHHHQHDSRTWSRKVSIVFVPNTDASNECPLGPNWLFQVLGSVFPNEVLASLDRVVVTQQSSRLSRYSVLLSNFGKKAGKLVTSDKQHHEGEVGENTQEGGGAATAGDEGEPVVSTSSATPLVFKFADTFGEALHKAGLDAHAVSLPMCLPFHDLKELLRYQQLIDWKKRAHRGLYSVLPMMLDCVGLLQMHGTRSGFRESFLSISKCKSLEDFACQPFIRRRREAHKDKVKEISSKNLAHLTILNPNNTPAILETNPLLFGVKFCHQLCLHLDTYRNEDWSARTTAELKALPGLSVVHAISELRQKKSQAFGLIGEKTIDIDVSHELTQLLAFITLQQHHVSGAYEWRERLTQIAWELYYRLYTKEDQEVLTEFSLVANESRQSSAQFSNGAKPGDKGYRPLAASSESDPAMWVDISGTSNDAPLPHDATFTISPQGSAVMTPENSPENSGALNSEPSAGGDAANFFNVPTLDLGVNADGDAPTMRRGISAVLRHRSTKKILHESRYLGAVKEFWGRNYDVWGVFRSDDKAGGGEGIGSQIPEDSMLRIIQQRRHILLYDRFILETILLLARRALESIVGPDGTASPIDLTNPDALKNPDVQAAIHSVQKLLFVKTIDWWKPTNEGEPEDADFETATFVLVWTLMRKHKYVFGAERLLNGPAYEALLSGWR